VGFYSSDDRVDCCCARFDFKHLDGSIRAWMTERRAKGVDFIERADSIRRFFIAHAPKPIRDAQK